MNEKQQEAIEYIKELIKPPLREEWDFSYKLDKTTARQFKELLNLIDKQQKEINNSIPKSKIRDKIDELIDERGTGDIAQYIAVSEKVKVLREILGE